MEGLAGSDANWYRVALSELQYTNTVHSDVQMFAESLTLPLEDLLVSESEPLFHPYVETGRNVFRLQTFGCSGVEGSISIRAPLHTHKGSCCIESADFAVGEGEDRATWAVDFSQCALPGDTAYLGFRIEDENNQALPIFARPMMAVSP